MPKLVGARGARPLRQVAAEAASDLLSIECKPFRVIWKLSYLAQKSIFDNFLQNHSDTIHIRRTFDALPLVDHERYYISVQTKDCHSTLSTSEYTAMTTISQHGGPSRTICPWSGRRPSRSTIIAQPHVVICIRIRPSIHHVSAYAGDLCRMAAKSTRQSGLAKLSVKM